MQAPAPPTSRGTKSYSPPNLARTGAGARSTGCCSRRADPRYRSSGIIFMLQRTAGRGLAVDRFKLLGQ
jgi:hypothetical protein